MKEIATTGQTTQLSTERLKSISLAAHLGNLPELTVQAVVQGRAASLRRMNEPDALRLLVTAFRHICTVYGTDAEKEALFEAANMVWREYREIGMAEIHEAYRLWAADKLDVGSKAETYRGKFTPRQVGVILAAYKEQYRMPASNFLNKADNQLQEQMEEERREAKREKYERDFPKIVEGWKAKCERWQDVPAFLFDTAVRLGMLKITPEQRADIRDRAEQLARVDVTEEAQNGSWFQRQALMGDLEEITNSRAGAIAKKIAVFEILFKKNNP